MEAILVGVDGGGTETKALALSLPSGRWAVGRSGPSNALAVGFANAESHVNQAISEALETLEGRVVGVGLGLAGVGRMAQRVEFGHRLESMGYPLVLDTDAVAAYLGATSGNPGVVVISGTGSIAYGQDASGREVRAGGWGYLLGDEGSGYWIGQKGMEAVVRAVDGRETPCPRLTQAILAFFGVGDMDGLVHAIYSSPPPRHRVARMAQAISQVADEGEGVAQRILANAGEELASQAHSAWRQLNLIGGSVTYTGGVFSSSWVVQAFTQHVQRLLPLAEVHPPHHSALVGGLLLAMRAWGQEPSGEFWEAVKVWERERGERR